MTISRNLPRKERARRELLQINVYLHGIYLSWAKRRGGTEMINIDPRCKLCIGSGTVYLHVFISFMFCGQEI
jgi:hypothetical protein